VVVVSTWRGRRWYLPACPHHVQPWVSPMFVVDEAAATAIRRAWHEGGDLAGIVELRRHFPLITDHARARSCVQAIVGWEPRPVPDPECPSK